MQQEEEEERQKKKRKEKSSAMAASHVQSRPCGGNPQRAPAHCQHQIQRSMPTWAHMAIPPRQLWPRGGVRPLGLGGGTPAPWLAHRCQVRYRYTLQALDGRMVVRMAEPSPTSYLQHPGKGPASVHYRDIACLCGYPMAKWLAKSARHHLLITIPTGKFLPCLPRVPRFPFTHQPTPGRLIARVQ